MMKQQHTVYVHQLVSVLLICCVHIQARLKKNNELVALKIIKIEPSTLCVHMHVMYMYMCTCMYLYAVYNVHVHVDVHYM